MTEPSYQTNDPKGWCGDPKRGAAMGRVTIHGAPKGPITVRETVLDSGGYDRNGTYFGQGPALYWYADGFGNVDAVMRASDIGMVVEHLQASYPGVLLTIADPIRPKCCGIGDADCQYGGDDITDYTDYCELCANEIQESEDEDGEET